MVNSKIKEFLKKVREFIKYVSRRGYKEKKEFEEYKPTPHERSKETMFLTKDELTRITDIYSEDCSDNYIFGHHMVESQRETEKMNIKGKERKK